MPLTFTKRDVLLEAPELDCNVIDSDRMAKAIADASLYVNVTAAGTQARADRLGVLYACHELTLWRRRKEGGGSSSAATPAVGPLTSVSVGGVSKSFASTSEGMSTEGKALSSTTYGQEFARLVRLWGCRASVS